MKGLIVFIGPSMVGKTTFARNISDNLGVKKISTDTLCHHHNYHPEDSIELFDDLRKYILEENVSIVDIGSNTIESCTKEEIEYLVKSLSIDGNLPNFYLLLPHKNNNISFTFLSSMAKTLKVYDKNVINSISESLTTENFKSLNPKIIYTLENYKQPLFNKSKNYKKHLDKLSKSLIESIKFSSSQNPQIK